jgi:hypothetical protein
MMLQAGDAEMNARKKTVMWALLTMAPFLLVGCAAAPPATGFLSDYSRLEQQGSSRLVYIDKAAARNYDRFIVDPVKVHFHAESKGYKKRAEGKWTVDEINDITNYAHEALVKAIREGDYEVVYRPAPQVARIRIAITDLKESTPVLNVIPQTKLTGLGLGAASMEAELIDSVSGQQLAAVVQSQQGNRLSFDGLSKWGDAKGVIDDWVRRFRARLDEIHGR